MRVLPHGKRESVKARTEALQAIGKSIGQLDRGKFFGFELLVDFGDGREENVVLNGSHSDALGLEMNDRFGGHRKRKFG